MKRTFFLLLVLMIINQIAIADNSPESKPMAFIVEKTFQSYALNGNC